ncbi:MAG: hypothetical protein AABY37_03970 [Actinomycetota bacterium]
MASETAPRPPFHISRKGLTKAGVVILQTLFLSFFALIELIFRHGIGIFTGLAICIAVFGGIRFGRYGTTYVSVVNPPLAFAGIVLMAIVLIDGLHPSRIGLDFVAALASAAPYLLLSTAYGWFSYFRSRKL